MADPVIIRISTTTVERPTADIDGEFYLLKPREELSIADAVRLDEIAERHGKIFEKAQRGEEPTRQEVAILGRLIDPVLRMFLDAPDEVHKKLTDEQRVTIFVAYADFFGPPSVAPTPAANRAARRRTGQKSSRVSNGSMAASQVAGSS